VSEKVKISGHNKFLSVSVFGRGGIHFLWSFCVRVSGLGVGA